MWVEFIIGSQSFQFSSPLQIPIRSHESEGHRCASIISAILVKKVGIFFFLISTKEYYKNSEQIRSKPHKDLNFRFYKFLPW